MSRESKKDKLRRQIVSPQQPAWNAEPEEDSEAVVRRAHNRVLRHRWILVLLVLLLIAAGAAAWFFYQRNYRYSGYETAWQVDLNEGSLVGYESFGTNVLKYTKDGASYLDNRGRTVWTESYEMKSPIISVKGDYAAIADMQGNSIYICNTGAGNNGASHQQGGSIRDRCYGCCAGRFCFQLYHIFSERRHFPGYHRQDQHVGRRLSA